MFNQTKKALEEKFNSVSTRVTGTISEYDNKALSKLKKVVETALDKMKANSDGKFDYEFSKQQYVKCLTFKILKGFIPTSELTLLQRQFPGLHVASFDTAVNGQVILVPKALVENIEQYYSSSNSVGDSSSEDEGVTQRVRQKTTKARPIWTLYAELAFWMLMVLFTTVYFMKICYGFVNTQFGFLFADLPVASNNST